MPNYLQGWSIEPEKKQALERVWHIEPEKKEALERVLLFDDSVNTVSDATSYNWPNYTDADDVLEQELDYRLEQWSQRQDITALLGQSLKDLEPNDDRFKLIAEIRGTFIAYMKKVLFCTINLEKAYRIFELQLFLKPLFLMNQYGFRRLFGVSIKKLVEWIHAGKSEFLLFFLDWFPDMITPEHYIKLLHYGLGPVSAASFKARIQTACAKNRVLAGLFDKYKDKLRDVYCHDI